MTKSAAEIEAIAARGRFHELVRYEIGELRHHLSQAGDAAKPFLDLIPIRLVTIIELSVRGSVMRAIDHGDPFRSAGIATMSRWSGKVVADAMQAISEKRVTIGEIVSHGFSIGRLPEILATLVAIFGPTTRDDFAIIQTRWTEPDKNTGVPIIADIDETFATLDRLLHVRHILVHERPVEQPYSPSDLGTFLDHTERFTDALNWILVSRIFGTVPYTQTEMNIQSSQRAQERVAELDLLRGGNKEFFANPKNTLEEREYHWDKFCHITAENYAGYLDNGWPGTIAPLIYASAVQAMVEWRIKNFKEFGEPWNPAARPVREIE